MGTRRITSALGERTFETKQQETLTVDDESSVISSFNDGIDWNDAEARIAQAKAKKKEIKELQSKAHPAATSRLELLLGIGRLTTDVIIDNVKFSLRSLKNKEFKEVITYFGQQDIKTKFDELIVMRNATLSFSLYKVDDEDVHSFIGNSELKSVIDLIEGMEDSVVDKLWVAYKKMIKENDSQDALGKTAEEIVENIKKS